MSLKINFKNNVKEKNVQNYVLFSDENFNIRGLNNLAIAAPLAQG